MKLGDAPAANSRNLQYFAAELQGMVIAPTPSGKTADGHSARREACPFCHNTLQ